MMALCSRPCKTQTPVPLPLPAMALSHHTLAGCANLWELQSPTLGSLVSLSATWTQEPMALSSLSPELKCHLIRGPPTLCSLFYLLAGGCLICPQRQSRPPSVPGVHRELPMNEEHPLFGSGLPRPPRTARTLPGMRFCVLLNSGWPSQDPNLACPSQPYCQLSPAC